MRPANPVAACRGRPVHDRTPYGTYGARWCTPAFVWLRSTRRRRWPSYGEAPSPYSRSTAWWSCAFTRVDSAGDIVTREQFQDFDLALECKVAPGGNSGIFYRVVEAPFAAMPRYGRPGGGS